MDWLRLVGGRVARINIEDTLWGDPRFQELLVKVGDRHRAKGMILELWTVAQKYWVASRGKGIPKPAWDDHGLPNVLVECRLARDDGEFIYAIGAKEQFAWLDQRTDAGKNGGIASGKARIKITGKKTKREEAKRSGDEAEASGTKPPSLTLTLSPSLSLSLAQSHEERRIAGALETEGTPQAGGAEEISPTAKTWRAYKSAYEKRHGAEPPWNAKIAGQLKSFVSRVPADEAPSVAEFYISHNGYRYVNAMHPVGLLLMDAEKLHTEWVTGKRMTHAKAQGADQGDYHRDQLKRIAEGSL